MLVSLPCHSLTPKVQHLLPCFPPYLVFPFGFNFSSLCELLVSIARCRQ